MRNRSIPAVRSKIPNDLRRFVDRVRDAFNADNDVDEKLVERVPGVLVDFFHIESCASATDYTAGAVRPNDDDYRVRFLVSAGATGATFTLTYRTNTYTFILAANESDEVVVMGERGIKEPFLVQSDTAGVAFTVHLFVPSIVEAG